MLAWLSVLLTHVDAITKSHAQYIGSMRIWLVSQLLTCIVAISFMSDQSLELNSIQAWYFSQQSLLIMSLVKSKWAIFTFSPPPQ